MVLVEKNIESEIWMNFKAECKQIWFDLRGRDLGKAPESFERLVDCIDKACTEDRNNIRRKVDFLVERFNLPFDS